MRNQSPTRKEYHGGVEGGRRHGGGLADNTSGTIDRDKAIGGRDPGGAKEMERWGNIRGLEA